MKIVAHNGAAVFGGAEKATAQILAGLQQRGHQVVLACAADEVAAGAARLGVPVTRIRLGGDAVLTDALRFARWLRAERADALLLSTFRKIWLAGLGARLAGVPRVVVRVGISGDLPRRWKYRFALRYYVHTVTINAEDMRSPFLAQLPGFDAGRVITLYKGVRPAPAPAQPGAMRARLGIAAGAFVVGGMGRIARQKRFDRLLDTCALLGAHVHCVIAGHGAELERLRERAAGLGISARTHFIGFHHDLAEFLDALDVLVVSSDYEAMCNAMLEAMAAGVPVVSTPVSGAREALGPLADGSVPGVIVGFGAEEIAAALRRLRDDSVARSVMGEAARRRARERFSLDAMLDRWEAVLAGTS